MRVLAGRAIAIERCGLDLPARVGEQDESSSKPGARERRDEGRASATLERVIEKLTELGRTYGVELLDPFARMLVVDAWLGNGDRHSGNWALITGVRGARLAPMYDPTACLGVELTDDRPVLTDPSAARIATYASKCPSGFGGGPSDGRTGISMGEVLEKVAGWSPWRDAVSELKPILVQLTHQAEELLGAVPDEWLSSARKRFAARLLAHRVTLLA